MGKKSVADRFGNLKFRNKLAFSTLMAALIPLLLFSLVVETIVMQDVNRKSRQLTMQMVTQTSESLDIYIETIEKLMDVVIAEGNFDSAGDEKRMGPLRDLTDSILQSYPEIAGITIAYPDDTYLGKGMTRISRDLFADEAWFQYALAQNGQLGLIGSVLGRNVVNILGESSDSVFSLVKSFQADEDGGYGVVLFDIRHDIIEKMIERVSIGEKGLLYVTDDNDVVYTPVSEVVYRIDRECYRDEGLEGQEICINGENYYVLNCYSDYSRWRTVGVVPKSEFTAGIKSLFRTFVACVVICVLLAAFTSLTVSAMLTRPIQKLSYSMEKAKLGDFSVRFHTKYKDEIGALGDSFNHMIEKINELINELYVEKQISLEAQLKSLQEQIKPHFLYNTLDTISWLARAHGAMDVVQLIDALTNMFRVGLSNGHDYISLREEKKHVVNYLYIQKVRYGERLKYEIRIPEKYNEVIVPKLILQPLVENAIYHGIKMKRSGGMILVSAKAEGDRLYLTVKDDGAGMAFEKLKELQNSLKDTENKMEEVSFGLSYMAKRIKLSYGSEYGIKIDSREGEYTEVTVCLPMKGEEKNVQGSDS